MATDPRKRQKKLEARAAKRKEKKHLLVREHHVSLDSRLIAAAANPPLHAWIGDSLRTQGIGSVGLSRTLANGSVAVAVFLVDRYCLGVKNALAEILPHSAYESKFRRKLHGQFSATEAAPAKVRKFVEDAVAYADALGLHAHADYATAKLLFGDIDPGQCTEVFEFGKDGKPFFISGPHDTPERCRRIMAALTASRGPGEFDYLVSIGAGRMIPEAAQPEEPRVSR